MNRKWTAEDMRELGVRHATIETEGDLEGTMATLVEDPVYDFWPIGRRARGQQQIRRYYEHLMGTFIPSQRSAELVEEWVNETSLIQDYRIVLDGDSGPVSHRVIGILFAEGELLGGERIWCSEECLRLMVGDLWDELETISEV